MSADAKRRRLQRRLARLAPPAEVPQAAEAASDLGAGPDYAVALSQDRASFFGEPALGYQAGASPALSPAREAPSGGALVGLEALHEVRRAQGAEELEDGAFELDDSVLDFDIDMVRSADIQMNWAGGSASEPIEADAAAPRWAELGVTPTGGLCERVESHPPDHRHGRVGVGAARTADREALARLSSLPALRGCDLGRALYIDTETTGLGLGSGTVPFLVGYARFEAESFVVRQLILEELGQEAPMLEALSQAIESASLLVSYNGRSFDWPLLESRYVLYRMRPPEPPPHLDLLSLARRVYKARLGSVRLTRIEEEVLDFWRPDDLPGSEVPAYYHSFLSTGDVGLLSGILRHNADDLIALAALLSQLAEGYARPQPGDPAEDLLGQARVAAGAASLAELRRFRDCIEPAADPQAFGELALLEAAQLRRAARYAEAADALRAALQTPPGGLTEASLHLALAKLEEHHLGRLAVALSHAERAEPAEGAEAQAHRLRRLRRRLGRGGALLPGL